MKVNKEMYFNYLNKFTNRMTFGVSFIQSFIHKTHQGEKKCAKTTSLLPTKPIKCPV